MKSRQKTFSIALSRSMVPNARILVYCVTPDGEVLTDSLNFHVHGFRDVVSPSDPFQNLVRANSSRLETSVQ